VLRGFTEIFCNFLLQNEADFGLDYGKRYFETDFNMLRPLNTGRR
jgi:hypothetical protein